jgi:peptide/nickel transport system substrate-binding protein
LKKRSRLFVYNTPMKKYRWQILILCITGLVVGILLILERQGGLLNNSASQPAKGGVYTEALVGSLQRLNPLIDSGNQVDRDVDRLIFSGLVKFDSRGFAVGDVAKTWGVSGDGTIYNFEIKDNVKWHDGQKLTVDDIVFTTDLLGKGGALIPTDLSTFWAAIKVIKLDATHLQFVLPEAFAPFLDYLTFGILPQHIYANMTYDEIVNSNFNLQPVGSGPFQFKEVSLNGSTIDGITLVSNPNYYDKAPNIEEFVFRYYADSKAALQAYKDGYVQGINQVTNDILPDVLSQSNLSLYSARLPQLSMVLLNLNDPSVAFFQDALIRKALLLGINRQNMINTVYDGQAIQANGVIFPGTWAYLDSAPTFSYDPDQAKGLLKQEGYVVTGDTNPVRTKDDVAIKFVLSYPDDDLHQKMAEMIQADWKNLDIDVTLEAVPADKFISDKLDSHAYQAALVDLNLASSPDPDPYPFWDQGQISGGQNYSQWSDRTVSDTLEQARVTTDLAERTRLYHNFQYLFADQLPALPLFYPVYNYAVDKQVQGVSVGPLYDISDRFANVTSWFMVLAKTSTQTK